MTTISEAAMRALAGAATGVTMDIEAHLGTVSVSVQAQPIGPEDPERYTHRRRYRLRLVLDRDALRYTDAQASELLGAAERMLAAGFVSWCRDRELDILLDTRASGDDPIAIHHRTVDGFRIAQYTVGPQLRHSR